MLELNSLNVYYKELPPVQRFFFPQALKAGLNCEDTSPLELFELANTRQFRAFVFLANMFLTQKFNFFNLPRIKLCQFLQTKGLFDGMHANMHFECLKNLQESSQIYKDLKILEQSCFLSGEAGQALYHAIITHSHPSLAINALSEGLFHGEKNQVKAQLRVMAHYQYPDIAARALIILFSKTQFDTAWSVVAQLNHHNWLIPGMTQAELHTITSSIQVLDGVSIHESRAEESSLDTTFSGAMRRLPPEPTPKHTYGLFSSAPILPAPPHETGHLAYEPTSRL